MSDTWESTLNEINKMPPMLRKAAKPCYMVAVKGGIKKRIQNMAKDGAKVTVEDVMAYYQKDEYFNSVMVAMFITEPELKGIIAKELEQ